MPGEGAGWKVRFGALRNTSFALVWCAGVISLVGDWALMVGLAYFVYVLTGSTLATGTLFLASFLPSAVVGSVAGVFVDRWSRKRTMVVSNLALAAGLFPLLGVHSLNQLYIVYAVAVFEACVAAFFSPAEGALVPSIVGEENLLRANSIYGTGRQLARLIGAAVGGVLVGWLGLAGITFVDAGSFVVAAVLILPVVEAPRRVAADVMRAGRWLQSILWKLKDEWLEGLAVALRSRQASTILLFIVITAFGEGIFSTLVAPFVVTVLHGNGPDFGWFNSLQAVGGVVGGLYVATRARIWDPARVLPVTSITFGALDLLLFNYPLLIPGIGLAFVLIVLIGLPASAVGASYASLQQTAVLDAYRGRYLGLTQSASLVTATLGLLFAGFLGGLVGIIPLLEIQGSVYVVAGVLVAAAHLTRMGPQGGTGTVVANQGPVEPVLVTAPSGAGSSGALGRYEAEECDLDCVFGVARSRPRKNPLPGAVGTPFHLREE
ncbi:MAG: MFS transporter [Thermoplasmata archaeon]|nr:MFS transporter [Thermoplasmata archaeon]